MVLENLFPENWLEKKAQFAFVVAAIYSTVSIVFSRLLFGANSGIVSVFFTALLFLPFLRKLLKKEETLDANTKKGKKKELWGDAKETFKVYLFAFLGIYFTYAIYSFAMPLLGTDPMPFFREQLMLDSSVRGNAFSIEAFSHILSYNWWVIFACFVIALIIGDGAIFFVAWNASSWGTLMGYRAATAALYGQANALWYLVMVIIITFPHMILEGTSYILASISGGVISDEVVRKTEQVKKFILYLMLSIAGITFTYYLYMRFFPILGELPFTILMMVLVLAILYGFGDIFKDEKETDVFNYHYKIFLVAVAVLFIAAVIESIVLSSSNTLNEIYMLSFMYQ